jgi:protein-S-isoprenylcysteine O-methyltransferase Ste14
MRSAVCLEILVCWVVWWYPFLFRAPHRQNRPSISMPVPTIIGLLLETFALLLPLALHVPFDAPMPVWQALLALLPGPVAVVMGWSAVKHLGRQFRVQAGLYHDHQLVRTGAYAVVRHPVYSSMLAFLAAMLIAAGRPWPSVISLAMFLAGTEIRVRTEDRLLASRFAVEFAQYRKRVPAYIPFVR